MFFKRCEICDLSMICIISESIEAINEVSDVEDDKNENMKMDDIRMAVVEEMFQAEEGKYGLGLKLNKTL